jgi:hypothetical protein
MLDEEGRSHAFTKVFVRLKDITRRPQRAQISVIFPWFVSDYCSLSPKPQR